VIITQVASGSPADKAGLKVGDIILEVENYKINNEQTLIGVFQEFRTGQTVSLKIVREEETLSKRMALVKR
jgi:S1-C subfamily serine protease